MGGSSSQTIGYRYEMGLHMGICRGPVNALLEIEVGGRTAWAGNVTGNEHFMILASNLFGGENGEGGIYGDAYPFFGGPTQEVSDKLKTMLGNPELQPEFRGVFTLYFDGMICSINPYPKPWKFKTRRITAGWDGPVWYQDKAQITYAVPNPENPLFPNTVVAMNPAHMIYECLTNRDWGRGLPRELISDEAFRYAADLLHDEAFGLCMRWSRTDLLTSFIQTILDHVGGALRLDKRTGLYVLKLFRKDYVSADLPVYTMDSGILGMRDASNGAIAGAVNEIVVNWHNPVNNKPGQVRIQNIAAIQTAGSTKSSEVTYVGCPTAALANKLAQRDLKLNSTNLRRFTLVVDRSLWMLQPGEVFKLSDPSRGIGEVILRVATAEESGNTDGRITITCVQDVFAMGSSTMAPVPVPPPPNPDPGAPTDDGLTLMYEKPYVELNGELPRGEFNALLPQTGIFSLQAERADPSAMSYEIHVDSGSGYTRSAIGEFAGTCELAQDVNPILEVVNIRNVVDAQNTVVGGAAIIGNEWVQVTSFDSVALTMTIKRGVGDTRPWGHVEGTKVWFVTDNGGTDYRDYAATEEIFTKALPFNGRGTLPIEDADVNSVIMDWRFYRPYLPGKVTALTPTTPEAPWFLRFRMEPPAGEITVKWAHRDRLLQADQLVDQQIDSIGPEPGVTYEIKVYNNDDIEVNHFTDITDTQFIYGYPQAVIDLELGSQAMVEGYLELFAVRDGLTSWQSYIIPIEVYLEAGDAPFSVNNFSEIDTVKSAPTQFSPGTPYVAMVPFEFYPGLFANIRINALVAGTETRPLKRWSVGHIAYPSENVYSVYGVTYEVNPTLVTYTAGAPTVLSEDGLWPLLGFTAEANINRRLTGTVGSSHTSGSYVFAPYGNGVDYFEVRPFGYYIGSPRVGEPPQVDPTAYSLLTGLSAQGVTFEQILPPSAASLATLSSAPTEADIIAYGEAYVAGNPAGDLAGYGVLANIHLGAVAPVKWLNSFAYPLEETDNTGLGGVDVFPYYKRGMGVKTPDKPAIPGLPNTVQVESDQVAVNSFIRAEAAHSNGSLYMWLEGGLVKLKVPEGSVLTLDSEKFPYSVQISLFSALTGESTVTVLGNDGIPHSAATALSGYAAPFSAESSSAPGGPVSSASVVNALITTDQGNPAPALVVTDSDAGPYRPAFLIDTGSASYTLDIPREPANVDEGFSVPLVYVLIEP